MFPDIAASMSASFGLGFCVSSAHADMIWAGLAVAALHHIRLPPGRLNRLSDRRLSDGLDGDETFPGSR